MRDSSRTWLRLSCCSFAVTTVFTFYFLAPIPDAIGADLWRGIALLLIALAGALAGLASRSWPRAALAVLAGLICGAILIDDIAPSDELRLSSDPARIFTTIAWMSSELASGLIAGSLGAAGTTVFASRARSHK